MTRWRERIRNGKSTWSIHRFTNVGSLVVSTSANSVGGRGRPPHMRFPGAAQRRILLLPSSLAHDRVDLSHSAHHVTTEFVLPVLEDADSIQITLGQIMRMIVCRQVDTKSAGLLLYGLQIASANLRRTRFEPYHKDVTVDLFCVPERIIGDEAWSPSDFANVGNVGRASPLAVPLSAKETHVARTPSSAKESCAAPAPPAPQPEAPSPTTQPAPASNVSPSSLPSATQQRELQKAARAIPRALKGDWRDVKTMFEFAGIYPAKDNSSPTDP